ncbi:N-acetylglucosamine-binding protein A [Rickettsiales bacterium Ac37b]|nr:N-acetylglucosamine-binding protein A [Rickettsiales bacterium Ac37b]
MFTLPLLSTIALTPFFISSTNAHGYSSNPIARQTKCFEDGGFNYPPDGSAIPNDACREAFKKSGVYQFTQKQEFSMNVENYHDINSVKEKISDGNLCSAGDMKKSGMNVVSDTWYKNDINVDKDGHFEINLQFCATATHNPSYWEVYLSKEDYNSGIHPLNWDNLVLIKTITDIKAKDGKIPHCETSQYYEFAVDNLDYPILDSHENAILYLRWQRVDPAGEGFYNCLDVNFKKDTPPTPPSDITIKLTNEQIVDLQGKLCNNYDHPVHNEL